MTPFYLDCCKELGWSVDQNLVKKMKTSNEEKLKELDSRIEDAEKNLDSYKAVLEEADIRINEIKIEIHEFDGTF
jgi:26S proteasome regulatory subunit N7